ncbi:MAG: hypothetical protein AAGJ35_06580, partial [Myxococcota bacterium]
LYFYLSRRTWKQTENLFKDAMQMLEPLQQRPDLANYPEKRNALVDQVIKKLKTGYALAKWQFLLRSQIDAQIGIILYSVKQDLKAAMPFLQNSFKRNWMAQAMLAVCYLKKHKPDQMQNTFELAVRLNKKQDFLWSLYAYCLQKIKKTEQAIEVLGRAQKALPANNAIVENLVALQNNKKMKMKAYGDQWFQFHLEKPPNMKKNIRYAKR